MADLLELDMRTTEEGQVRLTQGFRNLDKKPSVLIHSTQIEGLINYLESIKEERI